MRMDKAVALNAHSVEPRAKKSIYPQPFAARMEKREKRVLGDLFGLTNFGVNLTTIKPGGISALRHAHFTQDEFIYIIEGSPTLITDAGETLLQPGMCAGFRHGTGDAHQLANRSESDVVYLEVGDRSPHDSVSYPDDDLVAIFEGAGRWRFTHKNGEPY